MEYIICKKFGWTITEMREQAYTDIQNFLQIMSIESKERARELKRQHAKPAKN